MWSNANVRNWIGRASFALQDLYSYEQHAFFRDSRRNSSGAMSTNRAFLALAEFVYHQEEQARPDHRRMGPPHKSRARSMVEDMATNYYSGDSERYRSHSGVQPNVYTDAHALLAFVASLGIDEPAFGSPARQKLGARAGALAKELVGELMDEAQGEDEDLPFRNPVVDFQIVRSVDAAANVWLPPSNATVERSPEELFMDDLVRDEARRRGFSLGGAPETESNREAVTARLRLESRENVVRQLGLNSGNDPEFDPGTLLAAICTLQRFGGRSGRQLIARGIEVLSECQDVDGSWRADLLTADQTRLVYVSSLEMATMIANLLIADLRTGSDDFLAPIVDILDGCFTHLEAGYVDRETPTNVARGWGNDRTRQSSVAEAWTTALALQLVLRLDRIGAMVEQQEILARFKVSGIRPTRLRWPDLQGVLPDPSRTPEAITQRIAATLGRASDPKKDRELVEGIARDIVRPILSSRIERPEATASLLLYGPPGTRKTSLVGQIANALSWPLVSVSPPDFLLEGIEGLERRAQQIFAGLARLRRVVIIFDECEELLRRRLPVESPENRTHGAFITAGMLPRLQDLRDGAWCVFTIVTNTELDELDPAVVRRGRLDQKHKVPHPAIKAQVEYLCAGILARRSRRQIGDGPTLELSEAERAAITEALQSYDKEVLSKPRELLHHDRVEASKRRRQGEMREYFQELAKVVAREWDLPQVTFGVLDDVARKLDGLNALGDHQSIRILIESMAVEDLEQE
jgi:hypothetical protein